MVVTGKMYSIMNAEPAYKTDSKVSVTSLNMTVKTLIALTTACNHI